jgi:hypothetical protein
MANNCSECGVELPEGSTFCKECGKKVEEHPVPPVPSQPQQQEQQPKDSTPTSTPAKSRKKLIIGILAIIVAIVIVSLLIMSLLSGTGPFSGADSRFVGEWEQNTLGSPILWNFNSDGTLETGPSDGPMNKEGTWNVDNTVLCLYDNMVCYTFEFSNNANMVTLKRTEESDDYPLTIILTKKGQQGTDQTPLIECSSDSDTNRITITSVDENVKWKDIEITTNPPATWQVQDANKNALAKIDTTATITAYVTVGDTILVLVTPGEITVTLKFLPTNTVLGNWTVNI